MKGLIALLIRWQLSPLGRGHYQRRFCVSIVISREERLKRERLLNRVLKGNLLILLTEAYLCLLGQGARLYAVGLADLRCALPLTHGLA